MWTIRLVRCLVLPEIMMGTGVIHHGACSAAGHVRDAWIKLVAFYKAYSFHSMNNCALYDTNFDMCGETSPEPLSCSMLLLKLIQFGFH